MLHALLTGPTNDRLFEMIATHLENACDRVLGDSKFKGLVEMAIGSERFEV